MTGKERLLAAFRREPTDSVPWVPFAGVHAGRLTGATAEQVLKDVGKLTEALLAVNRQYQPDGQPVVFDLQIEAEVLGCDLVWAEKAPPSVRSHPLTGGIEIPTRQLEPTDGRFPVALEATRALKTEVGDTTALFGLVCGPFTLAAHLRGTDLFLDMIDDPDSVHALVEYCSSVCQRAAGFYADAGADVLACVDPMVSQISEQHFRTFLVRPLREVFESFRSSACGSALFVCGDATRNVPAMCETRPDALFVDENIDLFAAKAITDGAGVTLGGNIPLSSVMLLGSQRENMAFVVDLLDRLDPLGFVLAPGCDMPYDVPPENVVGVLEAVRNPQAIRALAMAETPEEGDAAAAEIDLPDYANLSRPIVEAFTLDSATCPACTYMMRAVERLKEHYGEAIDVVEYKLVDRANLVRAKAMAVQSVPSVYINGEPAFASIIPGHPEFVEAVASKLD